MEPIELQLISIHNMQEAKTNRDVLEIRLHCAASRETPAPSSALTLVRAPTLLPLYVPLWCWHHAVLTPQSVLQAGQEHHKWEHTAPSKLRSFLVTRPQAWKTPWCTLGSVAAWQHQCVTHPEGKRLGEVLSVIVTPSSSPPGSCLTDRR